MALALRFLLHKLAAVSTAAAPRQLLGDSVSVDCLIFAIVFGRSGSANDLPKALAQEAWRVPLSQPWLFVGSAGLGIFVSFSSFLVIKSTNSVTLKVLGTARSAGLVVWSALVLGENVTTLEGSGYTLSLLAFAAYNYLKATEKPAPLVHVR